MQTLNRRLVRACAVALLTAAALSAGCASAPRQLAPASLGCREIAAEIGGTTQARVQALEKQQDPWKFVIPFAVAGHHVGEKSAVSDADRWLAELHEQARKKGCPGAA